MSRTFFKKINKLSKLLIFLEFVFKAKKKVFEYKFFEKFFKQGRFEKFFILRRKFSQKFSSSGRSPKPFNLSVWLTKIRIIAGPLQAFFGVPYVEICILPYVATRESLRPPVDVSRSKIAKSWVRSRL